jgi:ADP-ribose pyrophosphatase YjhB (NUDIX family)
LADKDIFIKTLDGAFNYRVGAIIVNSGNILMVKNSGASFFYTVGGRVKFGESAQEAVLRESFEELQIQLEIDRLAYIHENFFVLESDNEFYHEISLFFLMRHNNQLKGIKHNSFEEEYGNVSLHWLPIKDLKDIQLYPEFFRTELPNSSNDIKHFVTKNGSTIRI